MAKYTKETNADFISETKNVDTTLFNLAQVGRKPIELSFSAERVSSDGGLLLLREVERQGGLLKSITNCIVENRHPGYIKHSLHCTRGWTFL